MKLLFNYLKGYWKLIILALFLAAINQIFSLLDPYIFRLIIDDYVVGKNGEIIKNLTDNEFMRKAGLLILAAMGVAMVSRIAKAFQDYYVNTITQKLGAQIYNDGLRHSLELPYQTFEDQRSGETLGILQKVRTDVERLISALINILFTSLVGIIFVMVYAINIYWLIAPVYFATIPILGFISSVLSKRVKKIQKTIVSATTSMAGSTTESLRNIELIKSLGLGPQETKRLNTVTNKILALELKKVKYIRSLSFIQGTSVNTIRNLILMIMLYLIFKEKITVGQFFSLFIYSFFIFGPLQELGNIINIYRETEVSLQNYDAILKAEKEPKPTHEKPVGALASLKFDHVMYQHQSAKHPALNDISFQVKSGETIAFVGPSGSGKTTLVKLLSGLYRPKNGNIYYNDINGTDVNFDNFREQIGFVSQDTQLFSGSIRENLHFVAPQATEKEMLNALNRAACQTLLARATDGLDTIIGEAGVKVSGGEKQRLSIARALLRNPRLLIFDEATSALDSITEEEISATVRDISGQRERITILIAHRLSTIMHADKIIVLEKGKIAEMGKHETLLEQKGLYYAMWRQQIGERREV